MPVSGIPDSGLYVYERAEYDYPVFRSFVVVRGEKCGERRYEMHNGRRGNARDC